MKASSTIGNNNTPGLELQSAKESRWMERTCKVVKKKNNNKEAFPLPSSSVLTLYYCLVKGKLTNTVIPTGHEKVL